MSSDTVIITITVDVTGTTQGQKAGLTHFNGGVHYAFCGIADYGNSKHIINEADGKSKIGPRLPSNLKTLYIRSVSGFEKRDTNRQYTTEGQHFLYSIDGQNFYPFGDEYRMGTGNFRGDMVGICTYYNQNNRGYIGVDKFHYHITNNPPTRLYQYHFIMFKRIILICMCLTCSMLPESYAQRAENLNLNRIVQPPYHCYGRLADGCPHAEELGWKVGVQFYTFHKYTFFEAIDLTRALGLHYIEATIGARICEESTQNIHAGLSPEWRERIKRKLAESGGKCESIYYWMDGSGKGFEDIVKFCKDMGWMIVSAPRRAEQGGLPVAFYEKI